MTTVYLKGGAVIEQTYLSAARWVELLAQQDEGVVVFQYAGPPGVEDYNPEARRVTVLVSEIAGVKERADDRG
jgi:hypothetical protein